MHSSEARVFKEYDGSLSEMVLGWMKHYGWLQQKKNKRENVVSRNFRQHYLTIFKKILRFILKIWNLT